MNPFYVPASSLLRLVASSASSPSMTAILIRYLSCSLASTAALESHGSTSLSTTAHCIARALDNTQQVGQNIRSISTRISCGMVVQKSQYCSNAPSAVAGLTIPKS